MTTTTLKQLTRTSSGRTRRAIRSRTGQVVAKEARDRERVQGVPGGPRSTVRELRRIVALRPAAHKVLERLAHMRLGALTDVQRRVLAEELQGLSIVLLRVSARLEDDLGERAQAAPVPQARPVQAKDSPGSLHEQARRNRAALVDSGQLVTSRALANELGLSRQAVVKALGEKRFFSLEVASEDYYPRFFADPTLDRKVLEAVTRSLGDLPNAEKWVFFNTKRGSLGDLTPLEALRAGKVEAVRRAAAAFAER